MPNIMLPEKSRSICVPAGTLLLNALRENGIYPDAACGGNGKCGKCKVIANGERVVKAKYEKAEKEFQSEIERG